MTDEPEYHVTGAVEAGESMLLRQFGEFYDEVIRMKRSVGIEPAYAFDDAIVATTLEGDHAYMASVHLAEMLERQQRHAAFVGGDYVMLFDEARYVMAALADEIFLHSDWPGRFAWNLNLLETRFYGTHVAGEQFFQRIERLVASALDAGRRELLKVYLMALSLGFQGKFRGTTHRSELERYRRLLYYNIALDLRPLHTDRPMFPGAYQHLEGEAKLLAPVRRWVYRLVGLVLIGLGLQHVVWKLMLTPDVWKVVRDILP